jgi:hypothetical protein
MKIGRLIRKLRLDTEVPEQMPPDLRQKIAAAIKLKDPQRDYMCASACFFIYVAGIYRSSLHGVLGIHRPYLSDADLKALTANQAMESSTQTRTIVETYLREMGVPSKYADLMFSNSGDQMYWIDDADFEANFWGFIPELKGWVNAKCDKRSEIEKRVDDALEEKRNRGQRLTPEEESIRLMLGKKMEARVYCEGDAGDDMREKAWNAYRGP